MFLPSVCDAELGAQEPEVEEAAGLVASVASGEVWNTELARAGLQRCNRYLHGGAKAALVATALLSAAVLWTARSAAGPSVSASSTGMAETIQDNAVTWMAETDPETGKNYFYSPELNKTVWNLPAVAIETTTSTMPTRPTTIDQCPGSFTVPGLGDIHLVGAKWNTAGDNAGHMEVHDGRVTAHIGSRSYWAGSCGVGNFFEQSRYAGVHLLGKKMKWTVSLSGLGCGCNVALYLTSMRQNPEPSMCQDYYCDAGNVCGVSCDEVDLMEANKYAWFSTLHMNGDKNGAHIGYGHFVYDWNSTTYGPGAACIDTNKPFDVSASFPTDPTGALAAMMLELSQVGSTCSLKADISDYGTGMPRISAAMAKGMTPIISYWSSPDMMWMDGVGADGQGPCKQDEPAQCGSSVEIGSFSMEELPPTHVLYTHTV